MNKKWLVIILCAVMLAACGQTETDGPGTTNPEQPAESAVDGTVADWFPFLPDTLYEYEGNGATDLANYSVYNGFICGNSAQRRVWTANSEATELMQGLGGAAGRGSPVVR